MNKSESGKHNPSKSEHTGAGFVKTVNTGGTSSGKCDFCSSRDVQWEYPAHTFRVPILGAVSEGGWAACNVCHGLIEANKRDKLARRSAIMFMRLHHAPYDETVMSLRLIHNMFFAHRIGEARRIS